MKPDIHPRYHDVKMVCSCGNSFVTRSTHSEDELHLDVCSQCHPFYTGKSAKLSDRKGRIERFRRRYSRD